MGRSVTPSRERATVPNDLCVVAALCEYDLLSRALDDDGRASVHTNVPECRQLRQKDKHMGDRSPKSNQKKSNQKQTKSSSADQKKKQAVAAKQSAGKKK